MSMFHLRDSLSSAEISAGFSNRASDVFSALGTSTVKEQPDLNTKKEMNKNADFDRQQMIRSGQYKNNQERDREFENRGDRSPFKAPLPVRDSRTADLREKINRNRDRDRSEHDREDKDRGHNRNDRRSFRRGGGRTVPDHKMNPHKWTKYSLADVDTMTDRSNTAAAMSFLQQIKESKTEETPVDLDAPIMFKRPTKKKCGNANLKSSEDDSAQEGAQDTSTDSKEETSDPVEKAAKFVGSKRVMPECVVGVAPRKKLADKQRSSGQHSRSSHKELKLSHLGEDEDEDE